MICSPRNFHRFSAKNSSNQRRHRSTPADDLINLRDLLITLGILAADTPFVFGLHNSAASETILVGLAADNLFYRSHANGARVAGATLYTLPRGVAVEHWPGATPSIRGRIRVFNDLPLAGFVGLRARPPLLTM
jgi:hypothetical protein